MTVILCEKFVSPCGGENRRNRNALIILMPHLIILDVDRLDEFMTVQTVKAGDLVTRQVDVLKNMLFSIFINNSEN